MGNTLLSLPIDVCWKRLAISQQMYAPSIDTPLPPKWESSVAVYAYEPAPDPALDDPTERTTFLKIVTTVTGFEPIDFSYQFPYIVNPIYFPAYSALIQLAVFPYGANPDSAIGEWPIDEYPYVADCQPQKRELIETTTEGGEIVTQSATDANIRKSMTNTSKQELSTGYYDRATLGTQGELQDIRTTDALQESRQTNSYSTQISQLYHLLDSYHTGTNRVIFFVNARPHLVVSDFTFAQGPRNLEGIQEFLVLVRRPAAMAGICVKAVLETAHLYKWDVTTKPPQPPPQQATTTLTAHLYVFADGTILGQQPPPQPNSVTLQVPPGFQLDTSKGGGDVPIPIALADGSTVTETIHNLPRGVWITNYTAKVQEGSQLEAVPLVIVSADGMTITVSATAQGWGNVGDTAGRINCDVYVYATEPPPQNTPAPVTKHYVQLFTTEREASGCISTTDGIEIMPGTNMTSVLYEGTLDPTAADAYQTASQAASREATIAANQLNRMVATGLKTSMGDPARYAPGQVPFPSSRVAIQMLLDAMGPAAIATRLAGTRLLHDLKLTGVDPGSRAFVDGITQAPVALRQRLVAALAPSRTDQHESDDGAP